LGADAHFAETDVADANSVAKMVSFCVDRYDRIDCAAMTAAPNMVAYSASKRGLTPIYHRMT